MSLADPPTESAPQKKRQGRYGQFWRATGYLMPYRRIVVISIISAFFVGGLMTSGLAVALPVIQVLIKGDSVPAYIARRAVEQRLNVSLSDDPGSIRVVKVGANGAGADAGLKRDDLLPESGQTTEQALLHFAQDEQITLKGGAAPIKPPPPAWWWRLAMRLTSLLPRQPVAAIACVLACVALLTITGNCFRFVQEYFSDTAAISAVNDIRRNMYDHILHIRLAFFGQHGTSDVTSRLVQDCQGLQDGFKTILGQSIQEPIKAAFTFGLAMFLDWRLTVFIIVFAPLMAALIRKFGKKMRRASRSALQKAGDMLGQIEATLAGIRVVKAAGAERFERRRYAGIMRLLSADQIRMARYEAYSSPVVETCAMLVVFCVVLFAAHLVLVSHTLEPGDFLVIIICLAGIGESLRKFSKLTAVLARSNAAAGRVFEVMDLPIERVRKVVSGQWPVVSEEKSSLQNGANASLPSPTTSPTRINLPSLEREIKFDGVTFAYPGTSAPAIENVSLTVRRGEAVAVVGRNGSGKTTLLALLPRFYDPQAGRILIDDVDIRDVTLRSLRRQVAVVTQDSVIFPGTVAQNIAYGHPLAHRLTGANELPPIKALREKIEHAAKRAFAHDFIIQKPGGYDAPLDGLGGQLSGGQKQRLNIARAILRQAPILILDEATSQVDAESEHLIQQAINDLMRECTTFVIAHRFSTIQSVDRIIVMDAGQVVAEGKHDELMQNSPTYRQLYERQSFMPV